MKKVLKIIVAGILIFLVSCGNPLDRPYNEATLMEDLQVIIARDNASKSDMMNLSEYLFNRRVSGDSITGTYRQLIREANEFAKEKESQK